MFTQLDERTHAFSLAIPTSTDQSKCDASISILSQKIARDFFYCGLCLLAHRSCCMCAETTDPCITLTDSEYRLSVFFVHATNKLNGQLSNVFNYMFSFPLKFIVKTEFFLELWIHVDLWPFIRNLTRKFWLK